MTITSGAGTSDPPAPAGDGGWGLGYGMSKGAVHRLAGIVRLEHERPASSPSTCTPASSPPSA